MKPRNKFEREVLALSQKLRPISAAQVEWAYRTCLDHYAYRSAGRSTTCMDCGHSWLMERKAKTCRCPECRAQLEVQETRKYYHSAGAYFNVLTTSGGYQVLRAYLLKAKVCRGERAKYSAYEVVQYWWSSEGKQAVIGLQRIGSYYTDCFDRTSDMAIRADGDDYLYASGGDIYPRIKLIPNLERNGYSKDLLHLHAGRLIPLLLKDSRAETLVKAGRAEHLKHLLSSTNGLNNYWSAYRITLRRGYNISDISMWCDYIDMLRREGKDTLNAHYVCPPDLRVAHDELQATRTRRMRRALEARQRENLARSIEEALRAEAQFRALKSPYFGIAFSDGEIEVCVLESIQDYLQEGTALKHCVFASQYYLKDNSLILSARLGNERLETIEVSLDTLEILQCRGYNNQSSPYHERIVELVLANIDQIQVRRRAKAS